MSLEVLLVGGAVAVALGGFVIARGLERRRREAYQQHCLTRGFTYEPERPGAETRVAHLLPQLRAGRARRWSHTITGRHNGVPFTVFEYTWRTGGGKNSSTHRMHGVLWETETPLPGFALGPEGWLQRVGAALGMQDIDFDETPDFSSAYRLTGDDESATRRLFTPERRLHLAALPGHQVAGGDRWLCWWRRGRLPPAERLDATLEDADRVRRLFIP